MIAKTAMSVIQPHGFILLRVIGAVSLFWLIKLFHKEKIQNKSDWIRLAACGVFGVAINQLFFFSGLELTSPMHSAIIMTLNPIIVALLSVLILKQRLLKLNWMGIVLGFIGAAWLISSTSEGKESTSSVLGDLFIFINATSYGIYLILVKPLMKKYKPITVITWVFTFGLLYVLPFGLNDLILFDLQVLTVENTIAILFIIFFTTFLTYLLNIYALKSVSPSISSVYIYSQPVFTYLTIIVASYYSPIFNKFNNELNTTIVVCTALIFTGVYFTNYTLSKN